MFTTHDFIWSILTPALVALSVLLAARFKPAPWATPLAFGLALAICLPGIKYNPWEIPPLSRFDSTDWILILAIGLMCLGILDSLVTLSNWRRTIVAFMAAGIAAGVLLRFKFRVGWSAGEGTLVLAGFAALGAIWWIAIESTVSEGRGIVGMILCWLIGVATAAVLMPMVSKLYGELGLALGAVSAATLVAILLPASRVSMRGFALIYSVMIVLIVAAIYLTSRPPIRITYIGIFASTALFVLAGHMIPHRMPVWVRSVIRVIIVAIPLFTAAAMAIIEFNSQPQDDISNIYK